MTEILTIEDLNIEVRRSPRRRTADLIVDRLGDVVLCIPEALPQWEVEDIVRRKQEWIHTKLAHKERVLRATPAKEYVTGEGFYYLGKKYRLLMTDDPGPGQGDCRLRLRNGRFHLPRSLADLGRTQFVLWYTAQADAWIDHAVKNLKGRVAAEPSSISIRDLGFRWGSCEANGRIVFHWRTILLPPPVIRYLVLHELVHLREHNHSPAFYQILQRAVPDYVQLEQWLELNGVKYNLQA